MISRSFERPERTAKRANDTSNRYRTRHIGPQDASASCLVSAHDRIFGHPQGRCDARERTFDVVLPILAEIADGRDVDVSPAPFRRPTQTSLYGDRAAKPGEMDVLVRPRATTAPARSCAVTA